MKIGKFRLEIGQIYIQKILFILLIFLTLAPLSSNHFVGPSESEVTHQLQSYFLSENPKEGNFSYSILPFEQFTKNISYSSIINNSSIINESSIRANIHTTIPSNISISSNPIIADVAFFIVAFFTIIWLIQYLPLLIQYLKQYKNNEKTIKALETQKLADITRKNGDLPWNLISEFLTNTQFLHKNEIKKFREKTLEFVSLFGFYLSIIFIALDNSQLILFPKIGNLFFIILFYTIEFSILGGIFHYFIKRNLEILKQRPKLFQEVEKTIYTSKEKKYVYFLIFGILILEFFSLNYIKNQQFAYILLILGILCIVSFFMNIYLVNHNLAKKILTNLLLIGLFLLYEFYWQTQIFDNNAEIISDQVNLLNDDGYSGFFYNKFGSHIVLFMCFWFLREIFGRKRHQRYMTNWNARQIHSITEQRFFWGN